MRVEINPRDCGPKEIEETLEGIAMSKMGLLILFFISNVNIAVGSSLPCNGASGETHTNGGGFVARTASVHVNAFVDSTSEVCDFAIVEDQASSIEENSKVFGRALLRGQVHVSLNSKVYGNALLDQRGASSAMGIRDAEVFGNAKILDDAGVIGGKVYGHAVIREKADILIGNGSTEIYGRAQIFGDVIISGNLKIHGSIQISGQVKLITSLVNTHHLCDPISLSGSLTINDPGSKYCQSFSGETLLSISPGEKDFGSINIGSSSNATKFTFINSGGADAKSCDAPVLKGDTSDFTLVSDNCGINDLQNEGGSCFVTVTANPLSAGVKTIQVSRSCQVGGVIETEEGKIEATGIEAPLIEVDPSEYDFQKIFVGSSNTQSKFTFRNNGTSVATGCSAPLLEGDEREEFIIASDNCGIKDMPLLSGLDSDFDFNTAGNYTASDINLIEISNSEVTLKRNFIPNSLFYASYNSSINGDLGGGDLSGASFGQAGVSSGKLDLSFNDISYVEYNAAGKADFNTKATLRMRFIPNYNGVPASGQALFSLHDLTSSNNNRIQLNHEPSGELHFLSWTSSGVLALDANFGTFSVDANQEYEIEINFDLALGQTRMFVDGAQLGPTASTTVSRVGTATTSIRIGTNIIASLTSNFKINQFAIFDSIQHSSNYTVTNDWLDYSTLNPSIELNNALVFSEPITNFSEISTRETGDEIRYILSSDNGINYKYWSGSSWINSNGSYAQSNSSNIIKSKISLLAESGSLKFKAFLHSSTGKTSPVLRLLKIGNKKGECEVIITAAPSNIGDKEVTLKRTCEVGGVASTHVNGIRQSSVNYVNNVTPFSHDFETILLGSTSLEKIFTFSNDSQLETGICSNAFLVGNNPTDFMISSDSCGNNVLAPGASCEVQVVANPQFIGERTATLARNCILSGIVQTNINALKVFSSDPEVNIIATPDPLIFEDTLVSSETEKLTVSFSNIGNTTASGCSLPSLSGAHAGEFQIVNDYCSDLDLPAGIGICSIVLRGTPSTNGLRTADLSRSCAVGGTISVALEMIGILPAPTAQLELSPLSYDFGNAPIGVPFNTQSFIITNNGSASATSCSNAFLTGKDYLDFYITNDNCQNLDLSGSGGSCSLDIGTLPNSLGFKTATLTRSCQIGGTVRTFTNSITTTSVPNDPNVSVNPMSHDYGDLAVGSIGDLIVTYSNSGFGTATGCSIPYLDPIDSSYSILSDSCQGNNLPGTGSCAVTVRFNPDSSGVKNTNLKHDCTVGGNFITTLTGNGIFPNLTISPSPSLDLGQSPVGASSAPGVITLNNTGDAAATGCSSAYFDGGDAIEFSISNDTCGNNNLGVSSPCTLDIIGTPTSSGNKSTTLKRNCSFGGEVSTTLLIEGTAPILGITPAPSIDLGAVVVGDQSSYTLVTINNTGNGDATGCGAITITGNNPSEFEVDNVNACGGSILAGGNCQFNVRGEPSSIGNFDSDLSLNCSVGGIVTTNVQVEGIPLIAKMPIFPKSHHFLRVGNNNSSESKVFKIINSSGGGATSCGVPVLSGADAGEFSILSTSCTSSMKVSESCEVEVHSRPTSLGNSQVNLERNCLVGGLARASLTATSVNSSPMVSFSKDEHQFLNITEGTTSKIFSAQFINNGPGRATNCGASMLTGGDFSDFSIVNDTCGVNDLNPSSSCQILVESRATGTGPKVTSLTRNCQVGGVATIVLKADVRANENTVSFSKKEHNFFNIGVNQSSKLKTIKFINKGVGFARNCSAPSISSGDISSFSIESDSCGAADLAPNASCDIQVVSTPSSIGLKSAEVTRSCSFGGVATSSLSATGVINLSSQKVDPISHNFTRLSINQRSKIKTFNFYNNTKAPLKGCSTSVLEGVDSSSFDIINDSCTSSLMPGEVCQVLVETRLTSIGIKNATLRHPCLIGGDASASLSTFGEATDVSLKSNINEILFGTIATGEATKRVNLNIYNNGEGAARGCAASSLSGVDASEFFIESDTCLSSDIASKSSCIVSLAARPSTDGPKSASLDFSCAFGGSLSIPLSAKAISKELGLKVSPLFHNFGNSIVGNSNGSKAFTFYNSGSGVATSCSNALLTGVNSTEFQIEEDSCEDNDLEAGSTCFVKVSAVLGSVGLKEANLSRNCAVGGNLEVALSAKGKLGVSQMSFSPNEHNFLTVGENQTSKLKVFKIFNNGSASVKGCSAPIIEGADALEFSIVDLGVKSCLTNDIAPKDYCQFAVESNPNDQTKKIANLRRDCSIGGSITADLRSKGSPAKQVIAMSPKAFNFQNVGVGYQSKNRHFTFLNTGEGYLRGCMGPSLSGGDAAEFSINFEGLTKSCNGVTDLAPGDFCQINLTSIPSGSFGERASDLNFSCSSGGSVQGVVYANGIHPDFPTLMLRPSLTELVPGEEKTIDIFNIGFSNTSNCEELAFKGPYAKDLKVIESSCEKSGIIEGDSCFVTIRANKKIEKSYGIKKCLGSVGMNTLLGIGSFDKDQNIKKEIQPIQSAGNCTLNEEGEVFCFDKISKRESSIEKLPFIKSIYKKESKTCFKTLKNSEICK
jgi:hypothetical protein